MKGDVIFFSSLVLFILVRQEAPFVVWHRASDFAGPALLLVGMMYLVLPFG